MKNIQVIDGAINCVYDTFQATNEEFNLLFLNGTDILFQDEIVRSEQVDLAFKNLWSRRIPKSQAMGIHGTIFYELADKKEYYPDRIDENAINKNGSRLR